VIERLRARKEWQFLGVLPRADRPLAITWWFLLLLRGLLPAGFAIAMACLWALSSVAIRSHSTKHGRVVFVLLQVSSPLHHAVGTNLGSRTAAWLYDELTTACVGPPGMGHLEDSRLTTDLTMARDFDLGISGPPMSISMDFIASGFVEMAGGLASAAVLAAYAWWAPLLLAGTWLATHWLLRESAFWRDRNTERGSRSAAPCRLRLIGLRSIRPRRGIAALWACRVDRRAIHFPPPAVARSAMGGDSPCASDRSCGACCWCSRPTFWCSMPWRRTLRRDAWALSQVVTFLSAAASTSMIAFGDCPGRSTAPRLSRRRAPLAGIHAPAGALSSGAHTAHCMPAREIRFRNLRFAYPRTDSLVLDGFDLTIPAGSSLAIVGQNGAGKHSREAVMPPVRSTKRRD